MRARKRPFTPERETHLQTGNSVSNNVNNLPGTGYGPRHAGGRRSLRAVAGYRTGGVP